jgi:hypothetical protein
VDGVPVDPAVIGTLVPFHTVPDSDERGWCDAVPSPSQHLCILGQPAPLRFEGIVLTKLHQHEENDEHLFRVREWASC